MYTMSALAVSEHVKAKVYRFCFIVIGRKEEGIGVVLYRMSALAAERLFKDEATEEKGERARMDKILQSTGRGHSVTVTNDGATILKSIHIDNPAAKVLIAIDTSKVQDDDVGKRMLLSRLRRGTNEKSKL
ncbi:T-complex protein 1 subunit beta [Tanacetum coccineum]